MSREEIMNRTEFAIPVPIFGGPGQPIVEIENVEGALIGGRHATYRPRKS